MIESRQNKRLTIDLPTTPDDVRSGIYELMSTSPEEIRCIACGRLLAKLGNGALTLQRGDVQATFDGEFHASFVCYQPRCKRLNVVRVGPKDPRRTTSIK